MATHSAATKARKLNVSHVHRTVSISQFTVGALSMGYAGDTFGNSVKKLERWKMP
jgi:hypothetical protein